jgi:hypothetical protein
MGAAMDSRRPAAFPWHYDRREITADGMIHAVGLCLGLIGAVSIIVIAGRVTKMQPYHLASGCRWGCCIRLESSFTSGGACVFRTRSGMHSCFLPPVVTTRRSLNTRSFREHEEIWRLSGANRPTCASDRSHGRLTANIYTGRMQIDPRDFITARSSWRFLMR